MTEIVSKLQSMRSFRMGAAASMKAITAAEESLGLLFSDEYRDYISAFGAASVYGHELTGICTSRRLHVVDVTIAEREYNPSVPNDLYVIEQAHIDGIVVWQSSDGTVYQSMPNEVPVKLCDSLCEYVDL